MMIVTITNPLEWDDVEPAANDDDEIVDLEVDFVDHMDRRLSCLVGWNAVYGEAAYVDVFDEQGNKVNVDMSTREAIVAEALK